MNGRSAFTGAGLQGSCWTACSCFLGLWSGPTNQTLHFVAFCCNLRAARLGTPTMRAVAAPVGLARWGVFAIRNVAEMLASFVFDCPAGHGCIAASAATPQGDTPPDLVNKWGKDTFDHYMQLYQSPEAQAAGELLGALKAGVTAGGQDWGQMRRTWGQSVVPFDGRWRCVTVPGN